MADFDPNSIDGNDTAIKGGSDSTVIGNIGDRLKITSEVTSVAEKDVMYFFTKLLNGSSSDMFVNGSSTPVYFEYAPASGQTSYLECLIFQLQDSGTTTFDKFGAITALTNGITILIKSKGTEYTFANFKNNETIMMVFNTHGLITPTSGFIEQSDTYIGAVHFQKPIKLQNSTGDYIKFKINDNLTAIDHIDASVRYWREI